MNGRFNESVYHAYNQSELNSVVKQLKEAMDRINETVGEYNATINKTVIQMYHDPQYFMMSWDMFQLIVLIVGLIGMVIGFGIGFRICKRRG